MYVELTHVTCTVVKLPERDGIRIGHTINNNGSFHSAVNHTWLLQHAMRAFLLGCRPSGLRCK